MLGLRLRAARFAVLAARLPALPRLGLALALGVWLLGWAGYIEKQIRWRIA